MTGGGSGPSVSPASARPSLLRRMSGVDDEPAALEGRDADPGALPSAELPRQLADRAPGGPRPATRPARRPGRPGCPRRIPRGPGSSRPAARRSARPRGRAAPGCCARAPRPAGRTVRPGRGLHRARRPLQRDADRSVSTAAAAVQVQEPQMEPRPRLDDRAHAWVRRVRRRRAARRGRGCTPWPRARPGPRSCPPAGRGGPAPGAPRRAATASRPRGEDARLHHGVLGAAQPGERPSHRARHHARGDVGPAPAGRPGLGQRHLLDGDLAPVARVGQDDPSDARGGPAREPLARERALREDQDVVGDVDDGLAGANEVPERPRGDVRPDHEALLAPDHPHGGEVHLAVLVQRRHHRLDDHVGHDSRILWRCRGYWPSLPP